MSEFQFVSTLWEWAGKGSWHFLTLPEDISGMIRMSVQQKVGFGSVRVSASIEGHTWKTSLFPDAKSGCYLMPVKAEIRRACKITAGSVISVFIVVEGMG